MNIFASPDRFSGIGTGTVKRVKLNEIRASKSRVGILEYVACTSRALWYWLVMGHAEYWRWECDLYLRYCRPSGDRSESADGLRAHKGCGLLFKFGLEGPPCPGSYRSWVLFYTMTTLHLRSHIFTLSSKFFA